MTGSGRAVVCAVGKHTRYTSTFPVEDLKDDDTLTHLQEKLEKLAGYIGKWAYIAGALIFALMVLFLTCKIMFTNDGFFTNDTLMQILRIFTICVTIIIVAIPEGLPLAVSISMAFSIDTMKRDNLLVKRVEACETLGYVKEICTGKTATLTKNDMTVKQFYSGYKTIDNYDRSLLNLNATIREVLVDAIIMNNDARIEMSADALYEPTGNGTEVAMLRFLQDNDLAVQDLLAKKVREGEHECSIPFSPIRKRQTTVIRPYKGCDYVRVVVKGAPEYVLKFCTRVFTQDGDIEDLDESERQRILDEEIIGQFARNQGLRTFAYAYKDINSEQWEDLQSEHNNFERESDRDIVETDLTFIAGFGIEDELRDGVEAAIAKLRQAGINTRMISGDNLETAIAVAKKAGIIAEGEEKLPMRCMTGEDFRK